MDDWAKTAIGGVVGALIGFGGAVATGYFSYVSKDEELRVHLVELAIGILKADPKEGITPARGWAIEVIEKNSGIQFDKDDRAALLNKPILSKDFPWKDAMEFKMIPDTYGSDGYFIEFMKKKLQEDKADKAAPK